LECRIERIQKRNEDHKKEIYQLGAQVRAERRDVERLKDQMELLQSEAIKYNNTIATMDRSTREAQAQIRRLRIQINRLEGR
jgi:chromosome segregation ATPase